MFLSLPLAALGENARIMADHQEYQVTARKWRPSEFNSVVGQEHVTQTLKNAIRQGRLHHAYLFSGPRGVGKTTTARILAKALNCENRGEDFEPCNVCSTCREISEGRSMDVVEIDGASNNSVEDVRKLRDNAKYPPLGGKYKLYIIDEVHMLSTSAFNALLKTLEEPPKHLVFVFATTEPHKVPATILSRCQRFDFRRMQIADIVGRLKYIAEQEGMQIDEDALVVIARKGDGSMRDSQSIFDQVTSFCGTTVTYAQANEALNVIDHAFFFRVTDMMRTHQVAEAFAIVEQIMRDGYDVQEFLIGLAEHFRNYLTVLATGSARLIESAKTYLERYEDEARTMEQGDMIRALHVTLAAQQAIRISSQPRLRLELALVQLATMDATVNLAELLEKIDRLPEHPSGGPVAGTPSNGVPSGGVPSGGVPSGGAVPAAPAPAAPLQGAAAGDAAPAGRGGMVSEPPSSYSAALKEQLLPKEEKRDSVKDLASFPTSAPVTPGRDPIYTNDPQSSAPRAVSAGGFTMAAGAEVAAAPAAAGLPALRDVQRRWSEFLEFCNDRKGLATVLSEMKPVEIYGNTLRVYVGNATEMSFLNRSREVLVEKLQSFFQAPLGIEGAINAAMQTRQQEKPRAAQASGLQARVDHPYVKGMIDLLEATVM
ncbi:MAG: DNA polymerase III subunit gamma/tau [Bacteroidetes bacterium]|nr:DNA polymerase III subunit gamma/tau [Bacteroidota bacterium]